MPSKADGAAPVSFAALALAVAGAGVLLLGLTALAVGLLPLPPAGRAVVAVLGIVATIVAMGVTSSRMTDRAIRAEYGEAPAGGTAPADGTAPAGGTAAAGRSAAEPVAVPGQGSEGSRCQTPGPTPEPTSERTAERAPGPARGPSEGDEKPPRGDGLGLRP